MQDELASQMIEQLWLINANLKAIVKRLDRIESAVAKPDDREELVILPRTAPSSQPATPQPEFPPIIKSKLMPVV